MTMCSYVAKTFKKRLHTSLWVVKNQKLVVRVFELSFQRLELSELVFLYGK